MRYLLAFWGGLALLATVGCREETRQQAMDQNAPRDSTIIDREYTLEARMIGYFAPDGTRNPVLKANPGDRVRITIVNGETMTHDIALEQLGVKSKTLLEEGSQTSITFWAETDDIYYCTVPGHRAAGMVGRFEVVEGPIATPVIAGIVPFNGDRPMNAGFERGNLNDWKVEGEAFMTSLYHRLDTIYGKDAQIGFDGDYYLSSGGTVDYKKKGRAISEPFEVTHPFASFKVAGGALADTRVEVVRADTDSILFTTTGQGRATMQPVVVDLSDQLGRPIFLRIIDNETGTSPIPYIGDDVWAHISFDDFRFYPVRPTFPNELRQEDIVVLPPLDPVLHSGLSGSKAAEVMTVPEGFTVTLAASEPDVVRPISFTIDAKGRLWVVEGHTYPVRAEEGQGRDRILIFEDTDGNGTLDKRKVFMEGLNLASGIEVGMGGVWVGAAPNLLFIPLDRENDRPAGPPEILLDGWGLDDTHEVLNNLRWGPDGWLYGVHGVFTHSKVGKPGTPEDDRVKVNGAVWRYHPTRHVFEVYSEGTSNPWGIDFNAYGHPFITVCVIPHMFHVIQGARYHRQAGNHFNPHTYDDIETIADHVHYLGDRGPHAGNFRSAAAGGGHAHAGAMIYLGNSWPEEYHHSIFMNNINGARINNDSLYRSGSGYVAAHRKDFIVMNDSWSQWLNMKYGPDGSVFAIDWYDKNQCHSPNPEVHDKTLGRIFKLTHEGDEWVSVNLYQASDSELVDYHLHENEWYARQARTLLQERGGSPIIHRALKKILDENPDVTRKLRALWTLHATDGLSEADLINLLEHGDENLRGWAIQLVSEGRKVSPAIRQRFADMARADGSALVRLYLASALQRLPLEERWDIIEGLAMREEDADDPNMPLMVWYALEPLAAVDAARMLDIAETAKIPTLFPYTVRRIKALDDQESRELLRDRLDQYREGTGRVRQAHARLIDSVLQAQSTNALQ